MDKEHFLNQKVKLDSVYLLREPNKFGDKIDLFYFCLYNKEKDLFCFLNDFCIFSGEKVRELVPKDPADRINCMYYYYSQEEDLPETYEAEDDGEDEYFYWQIGPAHDVATIVDCDEVSGLNYEVKECLENYFSATAFYKISDLCRIEKKVISAQICANSPIKSYHDIDMHIA